MLTFLQARKESGDSITPEQDLDVVAKEGAIPEQPPKVKRKPSIRRALGRAGSKVSNAFLAALRTGADEPPEEPAPLDKIKIEWEAFNFEREQQEKAMGGAFDSFQDMIEEAMDSKYKELKGEGKFLIYEDAIELPVEPPVELPVVPNEDESAWVIHTKKEEEIIEFCDPYTGSVQRPCSPSESPHVSGDYLACHPPKPRTYPPGPHSTAEVARSEKPKVVVDEQHDSTPSPSDDSQPVQLEAEVDDERPKTRMAPKQGESRLPRPTSRARGSPASGRRESSVQPNAAQPADASKSRAPSKSRKDSVQPGASLSVQAKDRYPQYRHMSSKK
ncbi:hypothetical protein BU25DRAFT_34740 [Macroventuria anomochaeta]|uniref:Uncharacterized protein n=1 Tax=Macroventuria anomochaeta TaxID=301207 RepID=A0ACB6S4E8_9PLEO|nr:uncharacterized protein BU25DRAFT_34740 [Macroventuria anomochaeta]KAF2628392.1 hypothetical protein BU25DRAFT_34740 [Macroventuria anomochaeta]